MIQELDDFFKYHLLGLEYFSFSTNEREAALQNATTTIKKLLRRSPDPAKPGELAALAEQTLWLLLHNEARDIAPRARRYLRAIEEGKEPEYKECFGECKRDVDCWNCIYMSSCSYTTDTKRIDRQHSGLVSVEEIEGWVDLLPAQEPSPDESGEPSAPEQSDVPSSFDLAPMMEFCHFLFSLDDYTLGILSELMCARDPRMNKQVVSSLAHIHGCSRQAMHRKMLASVRRHPELAAVFRMVLQKVRRSRQNFYATNASKEA